MKSPLPVRGNRADRLPPPRAIGGWIGRRPAWQQILLIFCVGMPVAAMLLAAWIGMTILLNRDPAHPVSAEATLNLLIVGIVAMIGFPLMHAGQYRWLWPTGRGSRAAADFGAEPTAPAPAIRWPARLRLRHALLRGLGIALLLATFAPYGNQRAIAHLLDRFSSGSASRGSLAALLFDYLPMALLCGLAMLLTNRAVQRRNAGLCDADEALVVEAEVNWMFSFVTALIVAGLLCRFGGAMTLAYLE